jgi:hypothetical protein
MAGEVSEMLMSSDTAKLLQLRAQVHTCSLAFQQLLKVQTQCLALVAVLRQHQLPHLQVLFQTLQMQLCVETTVTVQSVKLLLVHSTEKFRLK